MSALWEGFLQVAAEALIEFGGRLLGEPFRRRERAHPVLAAVGLVIMGGLAGLVTSLLFPTRLLSLNGGVPGASLILSPLLTGLVMAYYGRWREGRGGSPSYSATFWGGALFAFSMASVRFMWVGR